MIIHAKDVNTPFTKQILRRALGELHVLDSEEVVVARAMRCFKPSAKLTPAAERMVRKLALKIHADNLKCYGQVMGGVQ